MPRSAPTRVAVVRVARTVPVPARRHAGRTLMETLEARSAVAQPFSTFIDPVVEPAPLPPTRPPARRSEPSRRPQCDEREQVAAAPADAPNAMPMFACLALRCGFSFGDQRGRALYFPASVVDGPGRAGDRSADSS